jgi:hypothetical protein
LYGESIETVLAKEQVWITEAEAVLRELEVDPDSIADSIADAIKREQENAERRELERQEELEISVQAVRDSAAGLLVEHPGIDLDDRAAVERVLDNPYARYPLRSDRFVTWCIATLRLVSPDEDDVRFVPDEPGHEETEDTYGQATRWPGSGDVPSWQNPAADASRP